MLRNVLQWRRDVRHFQVEPIDEAVLDRLSEAMNFAPSVGNSRPWRVVRVDDLAVRAVVRESFAHESERAAAEYNEEHAAEYRKLKLHGMDTAPVQLAVFTDTEPEAGRKLGRRTMPETLRQSTAMAIYTLWLAARAENLGMGMVSILNPTDVERALYTPHTWAFDAWICLGYPEFDDDTPLLHRAQWQKNLPTVWDRR